MGTLEAFLVIAGAWTALMVVAYALATPLLTVAQRAERLRRASGLATARR